MQVKDIMVQPHKIDKSDTISHALDLMEKKDTKRLLVVHDNQALGVLTMRSLTEQLGTRRNRANLHPLCMLQQPYPTTL